MTSFTLWWEINISQFLLKKIWHHINKLHSQVSLLKPGGWGRKLGRNAQKASLECGH